MMAHIPNDLITEEILSWLPSKSLCRFRMVCQEWGRTTRSRDFIKLHGERMEMIQDLKLMVVSDVLYTLSMTASHGPIILQSEKMSVPNLEFSWNCEIVGSCAGILLLADVGPSGGKELYIINPSMRNLRNILYPERLYVETHTQGFDVYGIGQDDSFDYIAIHILGVRSTPSHVDVDVDDHYVVNAYSARTNHWTQVDRDLLCFNCQHPQGVFFKGCLHWLVCGHRSQQNFILSINLKTFRFECNLLPEPIDTMPLHKVSLRLIKGSLSIIPRIFQAACSSNIWLFKDSQWFKMDIKMPKRCSTLCVWNNNLVFATDQRRSLLLYDIDDGVASRVDIHGAPLSSFIGAETYIDSLEPI